MADAKWDLARLTSGQRSALKRNAGVMMHDASMQAQEAFYRVLNERCSERRQQIWFSCVCMECLWRDTDEPQKMAFQEMLRRIYQDSDATDSTKKQCTNFFDMTWNDDGFLLGKICHLVRKMRADNPTVIPDFDLLADDLTQWNHADRYIQRKWLQTICAINNQENVKEEA